MNVQIRAVMNVGYSIQSFIRNALKYSKADCPWTKEQKQNGQCS